VLEVIGKNAVRLDLPSYVKIHPVVHVSHTVPFVEQPKDISKPIAERPAPIPRIQGEEHVVDKILNHRRRGRGYQFLTLMKGDPIHDAIWQPTRDFVDRDGSVTEIWQKYIQEQDILPQYH